MTEQGSGVFSIGHSTHSIEAFVELLTRHAVSALADVRTAPISRFNPQFNKDALARELKVHGIQYVFLGRELGARPEDRSLYENGRVQYVRLAKTDSFMEGITRIIQGATEHRIAMMCAEREPLECHRTLLVARALDEQGIEVTHILGDGRLESHRAAMERLLDVTGLPHEDLFRSWQDLIAEALARQEERVAYVDEKLAEAAGDGT
jgi:uncharacterized protein (DUF488 family)